MKIALDSEGKLTGIGDVANGLKCNCICLECGATLIARNGGLQREKHFAHQGDSSCIASMTWLHRASQMMIESAKRIALPSGGTFEYHEAKLETAFDGFIADVLIISSDSKILIEVVVSNDLDDAKIAKIKKSGLDCIRIDLSNVDREIGFEELHELVLFNQEVRHWVSSISRVENPQAIPIGSDTMQPAQKETTWGEIILFFAGIWLFYKLLKEILTSGR